MNKVHFSFQPHELLSEDVLRKAYIVYSKEWHPDKNKAPIATEMMQAINNEYEKQLKLKPWDISNDDSQFKDFMEDFAEGFKQGGEHDAYSDFYTKFGFGGKSQKTKYKSNPNGTSNQQTQNIIRSILGNIVASIVYNQMRKELRAKYLIVTFYSKMMEQGILITQEHVGLLVNEIAYETTPDAIKTMWEGFLKL